MVVLEGHNMLGVNSPNQYLSPDYLSPLPTTLDAKKSPLALLVQTCSQIGADTPSSKSLLHPSPLSSSDSNSSLSCGTSGAGQKRKASTSSDSGHGSNSLKSLGIASDSSNDSRPRSSGSTSSNCSSAKQPRLSNSTSPAHHGKSSPKNNNNNNNNSDNITVSNNNSHHASKLRKLSGQSISSESSEKNRSHNNRSSPSNNSSSSVIVPQGKHSSGSSSSVSARSPPSHTTTSHDKSSSLKSSSTNDNSSKTTSSPKPSSHQHDQGASPIIRSGLDVLQGKDLPKFGAFGFPPGFDPTNPAFRMPFFNAAHHAHLMGYPPGAPPVPSSGSAYGLSYNRVKSASGVESIVPVCKDPYCTGCQYGGGGMPHGTASGSLVPGGGICPAGCAQCDHQKFPLIPPSAASGPYPSIPGFPSAALSHAALSAVASGYPPSLLSHNAAAMAAMIQHHQAAAVAQQQQNAQRPHVCSWIVGDSYCGKRFASSEELLQHLRTHTNSSAAAASTPSSVAGETGSSSAAAAAAAAAAASIAAGHPGLPPPPVGPSSLYSSALLNSSAMAAMNRSYPTPPLSPHSAARYNPAALYAAIAASGKPPGALGPLPPPSAAALAGYYPSPYSLYGPRIG